MARFLLLVIYLFISLPLYSFFSKMRSDDIVVYKVFGIAWGWQGEKKLSKGEVENYITKRAHNQKMTHVRAKQLPFPSSDITKVNNLYHYLIENPKEIHYCEESHYMWGLITWKNRWSYPVAWNDDMQSPNSVSIINETGEIIFVDVADHEKKNKKNKALRGIHDGKERCINLPSHKRLTFLRKQSALEPMETLMTTYKIDEATKIIRLRKEKNLVLAEAAISHNTFS